jgi:hypothetical protein
MPSFALLALIPVLVISFIPIYILRCPNDARAREFFVACEQTPPGVVQNSCIAYALQLPTFSQFFSWGAGGDFWPAIVFSAMFGAGLAVVYKLRRPLLAFLNTALAHDRSITVPAFIARQHGGDPRLRLFAAALTVFAFMGLVSSEAIGVASLLKPILPAGPGATFPVACGMLALMALYTIPAGNSGAMRSAQAQLGMIYFGLFGSTVFILYLVISSIGSMPPRGTFAVAVLAACCAIVLIYRRSRYIDTSPFGRPVAGAAADTDPPGARLFRRFSRLLNELIFVVAATTLGFALVDLYAEDFPAVVSKSVDVLQTATSTFNPGLIGLALLPLFYPIVDTTNWLRLAALETDPDSVREDAVQTPPAFARIIGMYAGASAVAWLIICMSGTIAALAIGTATGADILQSFVVRLASQQNEVADAGLRLLLLSVTAMAVSTMSAMFSASLATIRYDIVPAVWPGLASELAQPTEQGLARRRAILAGGALCLTMLVVLALLNGDADVNLTSGRFLGLQLGCLCAQLAFVPLVLGPMIAGTRDKSAAVSSAWAIAVLAAGVAAGPGTVIVCIETGQEVWLGAAVPACLGSGLSLFAVARLWTKWAAREG